MSYERIIIIVALATAVLVASCMSTNEVSQRIGYWVDSRKKNIAKFQCINHKFLDIECKEK